MMVEQFEVINSILHTIYGRSWLYWPFQKMEQLEAGRLETALLDLESNFERRIDEIWKQLWNSWFLSWVALWARLFAIQERPNALVKFLNVDDHSMIQLPLAGMSLAVYKFIHFLSLLSFLSLLNSDFERKDLVCTWTKVRESEKITKTCLHDIVERNASHIIVWTWSFAGALACGERELHTSPKLLD